MRPIPVTTSARGSTPAPWTSPPLTVGAALDFHDALGGAVKQSRLRFLRDRWVHQVTTSRTWRSSPQRTRHVRHVTAFRVAGHTSEADNVAIAKELFDRHRIFAVRRGGPVKGDCVRVTPALFTSRDDVDLLAKALRGIASRMRG